MAIVAMKHLRLLGMESEREALLRAMQEMGCIEISGADGAEDALQEGFARPDDKALLSAQESARSCRAALAALGLPYKEGLAEAERGTAGETSRNIVRSFYGEDCDANAIIDSLHRVADKEFQKPVPKKPGLDELLAWLDEQHIPMAVASSSRMHIIQRNLDNWGLTHYFKALASGQQVTHSKPDPEIFLLAAQQLGVEPARCLVLEDSYNGVRAGAAGGFVTVMVPDLLPADDEMRSLYTAECKSLTEVLERLKTNEF